VLEVHFYRGEEELVQNAGFHVHEVGLVFVFDILF
jgi:hypothetical protein